MDPITSSTTRPRSFEEEAAHAGAEHGAKPAVGPSARQVKVAQRHEASTDKLGLTKSAAAEIAAHVFESGAEALATQFGRGLMGAGCVLAAPVFTAYEHFLVYSHAVREGDELKAAFARDAVNLAFVMTASKNLPNGYVQRMLHEYRAVGGERGGASRMLNRMMVDDQKWQAIKTEAEQRVSTAREWARTKGLDTPAELAERLKSDRPFARAYASDLAVKHGIDSVVYEGPRRKR